MIHQVAKEVFAETGLTLEYKVGTMIEIPRAALVADEVYETFDLFCNNSIPTHQLMPPNCELSANRDIIKKTLSTENGQ